MSLQQEKLDYLRRAVDQLGLTQRVIAERLGENEGAFSGRLNGKRGITDEFIDLFSGTFKIPYSFGEGATPSADVAQLAERLERMERLMGGINAGLAILTDEVKKK